MSLLFKGRDLKPVLTEAIANQCHIVLVKDQGVYWLAEDGERLPGGEQKLIAYAIGCNPEIDTFNNWWTLARNELGGDDFAEFFDPGTEVFTRVFNSEDDLLLSSTATHLSLLAVTPKSNT